MSSLEDLPDATGRRRPGVPESNAPDLSFAGPSWRRGHRESREHTGLEGQCSCHVTLLVVNGSSVEQKIEVTAVSDQDLRDVEIVATIISAYVANNAVRTSELPGLIE